MLLITVVLPSCVTDIKLRVNRKRVLIVVLPLIYSLNLYKSFRLFLPMSSPLNCVIMSVLPTTLLCGGIKAGEVQWPWGRIHCETRSKDKEVKTVESERKYIF